MSKKSNQHAVQTKQTKENTTETANNAKQPSVGRRSCHRHRRAERNPTFRNREELAKEIDDVCARVNDVVQYMTRGSKVTREDREDIAQNVLVKILRFPHKFPRKRGQKAFIALLVLHELAHNGSFRNRHVVIDLEAVLGEASREDFFEATSTLAALSDGRPSVCSDLAMDLDCIFEQLDAQLAKGVTILKLLTLVRVYMSFTAGELGLSRRQCWYVVRMLCEHIGSACPEFRGYLCA
jgi:DNA-directed RNA polymerase specialized sigma24 family protein